MTTTYLRPKTSQEDLDKIQAFNHDVKELLQDAPEKLDVVRVAKKRKEPSSQTNS